MNLHAAGVVLAAADSLDGLPRAAESLGYMLVFAALILASAIILAAVIGRTTSRRATSKDPLPAHVILTGHCGDVISLAFSPDGRLLATASNDNVVKVWDLTRLPGPGLSSPLTDGARSPFVGPVGVTDRRG
jgi:WD domain, G-beta repeat